MQTALADFIRDTPEGREADAILRRCVHCGFCLATCPTYQLRGDELDSPRGRIYLIKQVLEGAVPSRKTQLHLDRCLTCRACEVTCPSGVQYARLADIGRAVVEERVPRPSVERLQRRALASALPVSGLFKSLLSLARLGRPVVPQALARKVPAAAPLRGPWPTARHARKMVVLAGCVQPALSPDINAAAARVLDRAGISLAEARPGGKDAGCCGALRFHLNYQDEGRADMRALIDAWWPLVDAGGEAGAEVIVMTASGCGATVREYGHLLARDPAYAHKAQRIAALTRDISEVITAEWPRLEPLLKRKGGKVAFQSPCTLQHGQRLQGVVERLLLAAGFDLTPVADAHLCCGSAGTYSLLQPELSDQLRRNKLAALQAGAPQRILTANIGCQSHLAPAAGVQVEHWIVALDRCFS